MTNERAKQILVVCTGNICRSPMAAGLIRKRLAAEGLTKRVAVRSAGVMAQEGMQANRYAVELLGERGIVLGQHATHCLSLADIEAATLILVMEERHRRSIFYMSPGNVHKVVLLSELANQHGDIHDPYGLSRAAFEDVLEQLDALLEAGWPNLLKRLAVGSASTE